MASLAGHASLLATLASRTPTASAPPVTAPDVWTGNSIDVERVADVPAPSEEPRADTVHTTQVAENAPVRSRPAARAHVRPEPAKAPDPDELLARKILDYHPAVLSRARAEPSNDTPAATNGGAARAGGTTDPGPSRNFARAFTRAIPAAGSGDPVWDRLALGAAGSVRVSVVIGEDGAIAEERVYGGVPRPPAHLERLAERTLGLLRGGRFVLTGARAGAETLRIDVSISLRDSEPLVLAFEPPTRGKPGRAYFQLPSRRVVEAKVAVE